MECGARKSFNNSMYSSMILNIPISSRLDDLHKFFFSFFLPDGQYIFIKGRDAQGNSRNACAVVKSDVDIGIEIHLSNFIKILIA